MSLRGIFIWSLAILFYFYEFFLRVVPATISDTLIQDLALSPEQFALIGGAYYITYSLMQPPVGILYDRFGVRIFLTLACAVCTLGVFGLALSENFFNCILSRLLIGFGSSFGFVSLMILAWNWFDQKYFGFFVGLGQMLGAVGPMLAGAPVAYWMQATDNNWRWIFFNLGCMGIAMTVLFALFIKNRPAPSRSELIFIEKETPLLQNLKKLLKIRQVWMTMLYAGSVYTSLPLLGAYWGTLYLQTRGLPTPSAAFTISMIWIGLASGSPLIGRLSDGLKRRKPLLIAPPALGLVSSLIILYTPVHHPLWLAGLFYTLGLAASGQSLSFAAIADHVPKDLKATAIAANNTGIMLFAALVPPLVTWIMGLKQNNTTFYSLQDFELSFAVMPALFALAFLVALFGVRETFCREQDKIHPL